MFHYPAILSIVALIVEFQLTRTSMTVSHPLCYLLTPVSYTHLDVYKRQVTSATNIRNCLEHKSTGKLPLKAISRQPVTVRLMSFLPFGEKGIIWNHNHKKLKPSGLPSIILCKDPNSYGYKFFIPSKNKIVTSDNYTIPNYTMDGRVRNTQNIYKSHQFSSHNDNEEDQIETVTNLCEALENYEDDNKPITRCV